MGIPLAQWFDSRPVASRGGYPPEPEMICTFENRPYYGLCGCQQAVMVKAKEGAPR